MIQIGNIHLYKDTYILTARPVGNNAFRMLNVSKNKLSYRNLITYLSKPTMMAQASL